MIDPGRPFSKETYRDIIEALEDRIRRGVERVRFTFEGVEGTYALPETVQTVTLISGLKDGEPYTFFLDDDFQIIGGQIVWLPQGTTPDLDSQFEVRYVYQERPAGLTDFNPGSVVGTLVRAVAREMKLVYDQMDEAYRRAFIDQATGVALDNVVALLGVVRNPAQKAKGEVKFFRNRPDSEDVPIEAGTRVADESGRTFVTTEEGEIEASELSATVPVEATQPGPEGNVNAGAVVIMPTPPEGVDGVVNEEPITGGQPAEADDQLRERAKHELERRGNATLNAIKFAVLDIDGVEGVEVIDHSVDNSVPLGEIRVMYSGGDPEQVEKVIEDTRAAGILAQPVEIEPILISGTFYLIPEPDAPATAAAQFTSAATQAIRALTVGEPLSVRRLNALAYDVPGLADVAEAQLTHNREVDPEPVADPFVVGRSELVRPNETGPDRLKAVLVSALEVPAVRRLDDPNEAVNEVDLRLVDASGNPIEWNNFSLDVSVTLLARLRTAPEQAPERVGGLGPLTVTWSETDTATLTIRAGDAPDLDPDDHVAEEVEVVVHAAVYPGIGDAETTVDLSPPEEE